MADLPNSLRSHEDGAAANARSDQDASEDGEDESSQESSEQDNTNVPPDILDNGNNAEDPQCCFERVQPDAVSDNTMTEPASASGQLNDDG